MKLVERFFHIRTRGAKGGATIRVVGDLDNIGKVNVQYTICSKKDVFCKKTGRSYAANAPVQEVALRDLAGKLAEIWCDVFRIEPESFDFAWRAQTRDFSFAIRYFLPK